MSSPWGQLSRPHLSKEVLSGRREEKVVWKGSKTVHLGGEYLGWFDGREEGCPLARMAPILMATL